MPINEFWCHARVHEFGRELLSQNNDDTHLERGAEEMALQGNQ